MECDCQDWRENIDRVEMPIVLQAIRTSTAGYDGKQFVYCPWCGRGLRESKEADAPFVSRDSTFENPKLIPYPRKPN